jgi:hypothetical protein
MNSPVTTVTPVVEDGGLKLVEEDDVAFTLALSREVHRLYGSYQEGELSASEDLRDGLDVARRMVLMLQSIVNAGMPAMRLEVMASQTREMLAVLFGEVPTGKAVRGGGSGRATRPGQVPASLGQPSWPSSVIESGGRPRLEPARSAGSPDLAAPPSVQPALVARPAGIGRLSHAVSAAAQVVRWLVLCGLVAVAIDAPIAVMALFPSHLSVLAGGYALIGGLGWWWWRKRSARRFTSTARL